MAMLNNQMVCCNIDWSIDLCTHTHRRVWHRDCIFLQHILGVLHPRKDRYVHAYFTRLGDARASFGHVGFEMCSNMFICDHAFGTWQVTVCEGVNRAACFGHQNELSDPEVDGAKAPPHKCSICDLSMALPMHSARHHSFGNYHSLEGINFPHDTSLKWCIELTDNLFVTPKHEQTHSRIPAQHPLGDFHFLLDVVSWSTNHMHTYKYIYTYYIIYI